MLATSAGVLAWLQMKHAPVCVGGDGEDVAVVYLPRQRVPRRDALPHRQRPRHLCRRLVAVAHLFRSHPL